MKTVYRLIIAAGLLLVCSGSSPSGLQGAFRRPLKRATFAAGCFWGTEAAFRRIPGVVATMSGYIGGNTPDPIYRDVALGHSGYAEAVLVTYDPARISYAELLDVFWSCHDPTIDKSVDAEPGPHRSAIFFHDQEQERIARQSLAELVQSKTFAAPIVTQIAPAQKFFPAEEFQQQFFERQGIEGTCHTGSVPVHTRLAARAAAGRRQ